MIAHLILLVLAVCLWPQSSAFYYRRMSGSHGFPGRLPRCHSESQPCRLRAELVSNQPAAAPAGGHGLRRVINNHVCSCPSATPCSTDWGQSNDNLLVRELRTNGNINITFGMMFCNPVRGNLPQEQCAPGDVALRLSGMASVPTEVDAIPCTCADRRPLVLHRRYRGLDFRQYDDYVCADDKERCNVDWDPTPCLIHHPENQTDFFPCKCPHLTVCRSTSDIVFDKEFRCLRVNL